MKAVVYMVLLLLVVRHAHSQTADIDSIHPLFKGKLDGDKIRAQFDNFEPAFPTRRVKGPYNVITLSVFHSRSLYTKTALNLKERLEELAPFRFVLQRGRGYAVMSDNFDSRAVPLFDSMPVLVTAYGINELNKADYRFRVLENEQKELVPWQEPRLFSPVMMLFRYNADGTEMKQMAYLGAFRAPVGSSITIEVKHLPSPDTVFSISAVWVKRAPAVIGVFASNGLKNLIDVYKFQWKQEGRKFSEATYYGDVVLPPVDSILKTDSIFGPDENNLFFYLKDKVQLPASVEYRLVKAGDSSVWKANDLDPNIIHLQELAPGKYTLLLRYAFQRQTVSRFPFIVQPHWYQTLLFKFSAGIVCGLFLALLFSFFKSRQQKGLLKAQSLKRQQAEMDLRSVRSQFNPHFVFNALNSIQGLIHRNDTAMADKYLSDFSRLMRASLQSANKEMISVDKELNMLVSYIELEKLRFGFEYAIRVDNRISVHTTEIPALLLQPLIENAIKHGISALYQQGLLTVEFTALQNDMQVEIIDNGKGFDTDVDTAGYGIRLTRERIALLSTLHAGQPVLFSIRSGPAGTIATLLFKNWLI